MRDGPPSAEPDRPTSAGSVPAPDGHTSRKALRPTLVATLGPASVDRVGALAGGGADRLRINASHLTFEEVVATVSLARAACPDVGVVIDLQGAKLRLGRFEATPVRPGDRIRFVCASPSPETFPLPHPEFFKQLQRGTTVGLDDGRMRLRVTACGDDWCETEALVAGTLEPRKGVTVAEHPVVLTDLTDGDARLCRYAASVDRVALACSYMIDGREAAWIRRIAPRTPIVGKVERRAALERLAAIAASVDEIWICRGDLGAEVGAVDLARWVAAYRPPPDSPPVLMAGQVLEHLTRHAEPTRSEVCHLCDLLDRGYAGIVLSDETAIGHAPESAVRLARALLDGLAGIG
jgi:pyruvate kinase